jgi:hypothetical protein
MQCSTCKRELGSVRDAAGGIAVSVMGDEYIYTYWHCADCTLYAVESYHDRFMGEDEVTVLAPVSKEVGDRAIELIRACPDPQDKNCDCPSHRAMYCGVPSLTED